MSLTGFSFGIGVMLACFQHEGSFFFACRTNSISPIKRVQGFQHNHEESNLGNHQGLELCKGSSFSFFSRPMQYLSNSRLHLTDHQRSLQTRYSNL